MKSSNAELTKEEKMRKRAYQSEIYNSTDEDNERNMGSRKRRRGEDISQDFKHLLSSATQLDAEKKSARAFESCPLQQSSPLFTGHGARASSGTADNILASDIIAGARNIESNMSLPTVGSFTSASIGNINQTLLGQAHMRMQGRLLQALGNSQPALGNISSSLLMPPERRVNLVGANSGLQSLLGFPYVLNPFVQQAAASQQLHPLTTGLMGSSPVPSLASTVAASLAADGSHPTASFSTQELKLAEQKIEPQRENYQAQVNPRHSPSSANQRLYLPLSIDEDVNWLSEYHCFLRKELVEVFQASYKDVEERKSSKSVFFQQVGIRCSFCAHSNHTCRTTRSSAFPSHIRQIYQSFTMMVRDHFGQCPYIPEKTKVKFLELKGRNLQGDANSKEYWTYSAAKLGLVDTDRGIIINERTRAAARNKQPFGTNLGYAFASDPPSLFVTQEDCGVISDFLYTLMSQVQLVYLLPSEQKGCRKSHKIGLPGLGCRHCCRIGRLGLSRTFPARRRTLGAKMNELFEHLQRCTLCPPEIRELLILKHAGQHRMSQETHTREKEFLDRIWISLGRDEGGKIIKK